MIRPSSWMNTLGCALLSVACSTGPNDTTGTPATTAGSGPTSSGGNATAGNTGSAGSGTAGANVGTGGQAATAGAGGSGTSAAGTSSAMGGSTTTSGGSGAVGGNAATAGASGSAGAPTASTAVNALVTSAENAYWKTGTWTEAAGTATVTVSDASPHQTWDGFGGAFNELGWSYLTTSALQQQALKLLFGDDGCRFAWGRIPIGASDYAMDRYTLNENSGDTSMSKFSIDRDKQKLIPYIKAAQTIRPGLRFWASPWTPPTWMKSSPYQSPGNPVNAFDGGSMKSDDTTLKAHALYFVKFIQAYADQGIKIDYVAPQNEPNYSQNYPSAIWSASTFTTFIAKYLGPALTSANLSTQIMLGTMSNNGPDATVAAAVLDDPTAKSYAKVMGVQWGMSDANQITTLQSKGAGIPIWLSEHKCGGNPGQDVPAAPNNIGYAKDSWGYIRDAIKRGLTAYNSWNMVLDKGGRGIDNTRAWAQNALLVVDGGQITQTPAYYVFRHVSQYVVPGAKRIDANGGDAIAIKNPDGSLVAIMYNSGSANDKYTVSIGGKSLQFAMPAQGWATVQYVP